MERGSVLCSTPVKDEKKAWSAPARRAFFPDKNADLTGIETVRETDALMIVPMLILAAGTLATGLLAGPILNAVSGIAAGLLP